jgi:hypothetical protein
MPENRMRAFADGVWIDEGPVDFLGMRLSATMAVLRLSDGTVLLYSPLAMTTARRSAVEALGPIAHLYAPNLFHHLWIGEWAAAFPAARLHAPAGLLRKRRDLRIDRVHGSSPEPAFAGVLDEVRIDGFRLEESVLLHGPSRTLLVADLVHNVGRPQHAWTRLYSKMMGFHDRVALSRVIRAPGFSDRAAARSAIDRLLASSFTGLIVGHGAPVTARARDALAAAYAWLPPKPTR